MSCIRLQKESKHEDSMIATYESTCLPYLESEMAEYTKSADFELASAAQQHLEKSVADAQRK
jgi:hypothetical protein